MTRKAIASIALAASLLIVQTVLSQSRGGRGEWIARRAALATAPAGESLPSVVGTEFGDPLPGITPHQLELFLIGLDDFLEVEDADEGLGPTFNGRSCAQCHAVPRVGGVANVMEMRAGILHPDGRFEEPPGGTLFQMFSLPSHETQALFPPEVNVIDHRKPLPLFGNGLVETVPDEALIAMEDPDDLDRDGISGRAARVIDRNSGELRVGRFGWKAQQATLITFGAEAYRDEMGITNALFPKEACPGGDCELVELIDPAPDPEDGPERLTGLRGIDNFESFMRFLGPPPRGPITEAAALGEAVFQEIGCASCHVPTLQTGPHPVEALNRKQFHPYGDFLLHDIGTGDGIAQADARPEEIRTTPLWGLRFRAPFLHNGRAPTIEAAIRAHGGEATASRAAFEELSDEQRRVLLAFLNSL